MTTLRATCELELEVWGPNEGCREFMTEPEHVGRCGKIAVERVTVDLTGPGPDEITRETFNCCDEHRYPDGLPGEDIVRRETLPTDREINAAINEIGRAIRLLDPRFYEETMEAGCTNEEPAADNFRSLIFRGCKLMFDLNAQLSQ